MSTQEVRTETTLATANGGMAGAKTVRKIIVRKVMTQSLKTGETADNVKKKDLRVAAYCRVSTLLDEQELSYESQREYYNHLVAGTPGMELVEVYGDRGFSGLHADSRPEFMRMIRDAKNGKMDEILVKSISRFSRNVIDCQKYLEVLKEHGVRVKFERENLSSDDPQCELVLKMLSAAAQEESNSISQNTRWAMQKNIENGNPTRACPYGYVKACRREDRHHVWLIDEPKAERIRYLFELAEKETSTKQIAKLMCQYEETHGQTTDWSRYKVRSRLRNEAYKGDILTAKTYIPDFVTGKHKANRGMVPQVYFMNHHPAIVNRECFDRIQEYFRNGRLV